MKTDTKFNCDVVPTTWSEFRLQMGELLKLINAPEGMIEETVELGLEGGGVVQALFSSWAWLEEVLATEDRPKCWDDMDGMVFDTIQDMAIEYSNPLNYPPGHKEKVDHYNLACEAMKHI